MNDPTMRLARATCVAGLVVWTMGCAASRGGAGANWQGPTDPSALRAQITSMLASSARAWNRGDLRAFVDDYVPSDSTTFIGSHGVVRGPEAIMQGYARRFEPGAVRDSLSFELLDVDRLGPDAINVIARYILARRLPDGRDSVTSQGPTSLVMKWRGGRWRIAHDHSS